MVSLQKKDTPPPKRIFIFFFYVSPLGCAYFGFLFSSCLGPVIKGYHRRLERMGMVVGFWRGLLDIGYW